MLPLLLQCLYAMQCCAGLLDLALHRHVKMLPCCCSIFGPRSSTRRFMLLMLNDLRLRLLEHLRLFHSTSVCLLINDVSCTHLAQHTWLLGLRAPIPSLFATEESEHTTALLCSPTPFSYCIGWKGCSLISQVRPTPFFAKYHLHSSALAQLARRSLRSLWWNRSAERFRCRYRSCHTLLGLRMLLLLRLLRKCCSKFFHWGKVLFVSDVDCGRRQRWRAVRRGRLRTRLGLCRRYCIEVIFWHFASDCCCCLSV
jgi:hypothetical protein